MISIVLASALVASEALYYNTSWSVAKSTTFDARWDDAKVFVTNAVMDEPLEIDVRNTDQKIIGFGTAVSELSWKSLKYLDEPSRKAVLDELFLPKNGNFTVIRTPIGASDFALDYYSYNDNEGDYSMEKFSIDHDEATLLPLLREVVRRVPADKLKVWASPWCPPKWMKTTGCYASRPPNAGGVPNDCTPGDRVYEGEDGFRCDDRHFRAYAKYFRMYVDAYREAGVPIWMVMPQNEFNSDQPYPSCTWTARSLACFMGKYLGPALENSGTELYFGTIERASMDIVNTVLRDPDCAKYVKGAGFQWAGKHAIEAVRRRYPDLPVMQTEQECGDGRNDWNYARYCWKLMRHYLSYGASIYEYWNMALPDDALSRWGWKQNSLVSVSPATGEWRFNVEYYILKHVSSNVRRGARRVLTDGYEDSLVFVNEDKSVVVVLGNESAETKEVPVVIGGRVLKAVLQPNSVSSFVVR